MLLHSCPKIFTDCRFFSDFRKTPENVSDSTPISAEVPVSSRSPT